MRAAATDLDDLVKASLPGCVCLRIQDDNYDYLDSSEDCRHHAQLHHLRESLKADYTKMEKALKNETRLKLVTAALEGSAMQSSTTDYVNQHVSQAIAIADEAIRRLTETS
jgi:hypothetical protein